MSLPGRSEPVGVSALRSHTSLALGREEVESILAERGDVEITCDFCNARYAFDAVDVGHLFASGATREADASTRH